MKVKEETDRRQSPTERQPDTGGRLLYITWSKWVQKYFGSRSKSGGGECEVIAVDPETYYVIFKGEDAQQRVLEKKNHVIQFIPAEVKIADGQDVLRYKDELINTASSDSTKLKTQDIYSSDRKRKDNDQEELDLSTREEQFDKTHKSRLAEHNKFPHSDMTRTYYPGSTTGAEERPQLDHPEIFPIVLAQLNIDLIGKVIIQEMQHKFPYIKMEPIREVIKVRGTFSEINKLHNYLQEQLGGKINRSSESRTEKSLTEDLEDCLCVPEALYKYFQEIYPEEAKNIETQCKVRISHVNTSQESAFIKFYSLGSDSAVDHAKQRFTTKIQKITSDWGQKEVSLSGIKVLPQDMKQFIKERYSKILVIEDGDKIVLRGPEYELSKAVELLEKGEVKPVLPRRVVTISSRDETEVLVDVGHMDILQKLKYREIRDIEQKYNVKMEERSKGRSVCVTFRALNGSPDLGPYACHSFISLLQKTITNIEKKIITVKPELKEGILGPFHKELQSGGVDIILEYSKGSVALIGSPIHVAFAGEKLIGFCNPQGAPEAAASGGDTEEPMDTDDQEDKCPICLDKIQNKEALSKCKHVFCADCLREAMTHKPVCPICSVSYGVLTGNQPDGTMSDKVLRESLQGFLGCGTIEIHYNIQSGSQKQNHPRPGKYFSGTSRTAYLPDNKEGKEILRLLKRAFDQRLIFTVGDSRTTGATDTVTWNDIHHKTSRFGGPANFGYPDPDYLKRVRDELKAKGIE
ncbi:E3 ubiquitin-protein ligase DTX3L isoform X2 [Mixophyes fleayi]|uniref:E3 ubiquitin-protein ligase DTX3L isoform X2 n=1 Tax=Mixophyes fleayi TaxID=3061075 RepID=UPI003F4DEDC0